MKQYAVILFALTAISVFAVPASASVIRVDSGGSGDYTAIQAAVDAALAGDEIRVAAGTYNENVIFDNTTTPDNIKLLGGYDTTFTNINRSITSNVTVIDAGGVDNVILITGVSGVELDGFTLRGSDANGTVAGVYIYASSPVITNNIIESNHHGIYIEGNSSPVIQRNLINTNSVFAIYCFSFGGAGTPWIYNNTIDQNHTGIDLYWFSPRILNNIVTSNTEYGISANVNSSPLVDYNCSWNNGLDDYYNVPPGTHGLMQDPLYTGSGDYTLQVSPTLSICVDAGTDVGLAYNGHLPDMGAYESSGARSVPWPPTGLAASPLSAKTHLSWDANAEPDVIGYKVGYGTVSGSYTNTVDVGNVTEIVIDNLTNNVQYFFAVRAYFDAVNISGYSNESPATPSNGNPELPHYAWDESFAGDCSGCHYTQTAGRLLPTGYNYNYSTELCLSCHNITGTARGRLIDQSNSHPVMVNVTTGGNQSPTYGIIGGRFSNQMGQNLKGGDTIACVTCHNIMEKTESPGRAWELTAKDGLNPLLFNLANGGWAYYDFTEPVVYGSASLMSAPTNIKDRRDYLLASNSLDDYSPSAGTITFSAAYNDYAYVTLYYPYLRVSNSENNMCSDCHTSHQTHQGANCMTCHELHNYGNRLGIKQSVKTPNSGIKSVVFTSVTSTGSFADGDAVYDGICEVCHTQTLYHTNNGSGFTNHTSTGIDYSGTDCTTCHTHANGFAP